MDRCYLQLSFEERIKIAKWREAKMPIPEIADRLSRAPSTIYRDLKRNHFDGGDLPELAGYYALNAQTMSEKRRAGLPTSPRASQTPQTA
ncbi:helix-turn-helix domain-containing protein, partial [Yangia mangrovi]